jgi:hypothetical protein
MAWHSGHGHAEPVSISPTAVPGGAIDPETCWLILLRPNPVARLSRRRDMVFLRRFP